MTPALWPIAGSAALGLARTTASAVGEGLSFAAELLKGSGGQQPGSGTAELSTVDDERQSLLGRLGQLADRIRQRLSAAGIRLTEAVEIEEDGLGGMAASDRHPQQAAIENALFGDVLLQRDFCRLASEFAEFTATHGTDGLPAKYSAVVAPE